MECAFLTNHPSHDSTNVLSDGKQVCDRPRIQQGVWYFVLSDYHSTVLTTNTQGSGHALVYGLECIL